jgi:hypothetical protein
MLAIFCLRLACGLVVSLGLFSAHQVNPRFYRTHFLAALGLTAGAAVAGRGMAGTWWWGTGAVLGLAFLGSLVWSLQGAPAGRLLIGLTAVSLAVTLALAAQARFVEMTAASPEAAPVPALGLVADEMTSAALLGIATTAMLMGHSYLIAPAMSLTPLLRLLAALVIAIVLRMGLAAAGLWSWTQQHALVNLESATVLWLPLRWGVGLAAPLVLCWMAWESARIRSTQSATGILYVVVIFCFLGELTSQLLYSNTGYLL